MFDAHDHACMSRALQLARKGLYSTGENPRVGCVISRGQRIIAEGWHCRTGEAHAEINAINNASEAISGATVYITLEPCSHHGRTPPCCEALVKQQVARVVVAMRDPNPQVAGRGTDCLEKHGIVVDNGLLAGQAAELNCGFISRMTRGRPWVRVKLASSLDGRSALANGASQWITGAAARADGHHWRARAGCILSGSGTVNADNPQLTVRLDHSDTETGAEIRQPSRAIIDSALSVAPAAALFSEAGEILIYSLKENAAFEQQTGARIIACPANNKGKVDLDFVLRNLAERGVNEVHVEAGAGLCGALLVQNSVDELLIYQAATVLGSAARGLFDFPELQNMDEQIRFTLHDVRRIGDDIRLCLRPMRNQ